MRGVRHDPVVGLRRKQRHQRIDSIGYGAITAKRRTPQENWDRHASQTLAAEQAVKNCRIRQYGGSDPGIVD